jgi:hypothetical protein
LTVKSAEDKIDKYRLILGEIFRSEEDLKFGLELFIISYQRVPEVAEIETIIENLSNFWSLFKIFD